MSAKVEFTIINLGTLSMNKFWHETERLRTPSATCTLLQSGDVRLLVDPSPTPDLLAPMLFARTGLRPDAIDAIYVTHWHGDHRFGLDLFEGVPWLMAEEGLAEWRAHAPQDEALFQQFQPAAGQLPAGMRLYPSPGHAVGHTSLLIDTQWGPTIVAGDAVMTRDYYRAEEGFHNSVDFGQATATIRAIKQAAKLVIPGHDNLILNL